MFFRSVILFLGLALPSLSFCIDPDPAGIHELEKASLERKDPDVFYNLGALYADSGNTGKAVLNFRKAVLLRPSDREARASLDTLRQSIGIPPYFSESSPIEKALLFPFLAFSLNASLIFGLVLFIAGSTALSLVISGLSERMSVPVKKNVMRALGIGFLILGSVYILSSFIRYRFTFDPKNAVVLKDTKLLEIPESGSLTIADIPGGMECAVRDARNGYYRIGTIDGREGWIPGNEVERLWDGER